MLVLAALDGAPTYLLTANDTFLAVFLFCFNDRQPLLVAPVKTVTWRTT